MPDKAFRDKNIRRIALLTPIETMGVRQAICRFQKLTQKLGIEVRCFNKSEAVLDFKPDCILALSHQDAKLTPFPTYGVLAGPVNEYLKTRRFVRNVLTYDAYLTTSPEVRCWLQDIAFGARKFSAPVAHFMLSIPATEFKAWDAGTAKLAHIGTNRDPGRFVPLLRELAEHEAIEIYGPPGCWEALPRNVNRGSVPADGDSALRVYQTAGAGLDLHPAGCPDDQPPSIRILEIIASSAIAISPLHPFLESVFGETLLYFDPNSSPREAARQILGHLGWVRSNPESALKKAQQAHGIFCNLLAQERFLDPLWKLHQKVLIEKGYQPDPDPKVEEELPSVTYIMRTGGGRPLNLLQRALDSLAAQRYPGLTVLFVLFRPFPELDSIRLKYPDLRTRIVEDFGGLRSTAICAGMGHVDTDYFGLLDDDDMMHPNHVRMLIKALRYHDRRNWRGPVGMAYSGSIEVSDAEPRCEQHEYEDAYALVRRELRAIEHYRFYNSGAMSQHAWYMITPWLAHRSLLDAELLNDPKIHTCEDLPIALQLAQKTFLAFSGEVTTNHCFQGLGNSTIQDAGRHLSDTMRFATRMWTRLFPIESGYHPQHPPLGRQTKREPGNPPEVGVNIIGQLTLPAGAIREHGRIVLKGEDTQLRRLGARPFIYDPGAYTLSLQFEPLSVPAEDVFVWIKMGLYFGESDGGKPLSQPSYGRKDLIPRGDLLCADMKFLVEHSEPQPAVGLVFERTPSLQCVVHRIMLIRHDSPYSS